MRTPLMSFFLDSFNTRHFLFENSTIKSWSHIWLILNRFTLKPSTYSTFAMSNSLHNEMVPPSFNLWFALITESDITTFLRLENLKERSVSSHVSWAAAVKVPQTCVHNLKCRLYHEAHLMLRWKIGRNGVFSHLPFMNKAFNFHSS